MKNAQQLEVADKSATYLLPADAYCILAEHNKRLIFNVILYWRKRHVSVGLGRDYSDVTPLKGTYIGGEATDLDVVVEIIRLA